MTALDTKALLEGVVGEWELCFTEDAPNFPPAPFVATLGDVVCIAEPNHEQPDEFDARNFRLIASAPRLARRVIELEEALAQARRFVALSCVDADPEVQEEARNTLPTIDAALKGEGE